MGWFSLGSFVGVAFVLYAAHISHHFYALFNPALCKEGDRHEACVTPVIAPTNGQWPLLQLRVYTTSGKGGMHLAHVFREFDVGMESEKEVSIPLPKSTRNNGSLGAFVYLLPHGWEGDKPNSAPWYVEDYVSLSTWRVPVAGAFNLMGGEENKEKAKEAKTSSIGRKEKPVTHIRSVLPIRIVSDAVHYSRNEFPAELRHLMKTRQEGKALKYFPIMRIEHLSMRTKHLNEVKPSNESTLLTISYAPASVGVTRLYVSTELSLRGMEQFHLGEDDLDEVKGIFVDTNPLLLTLTILVSALHLCFDFLAFKNDISFWRSRKSMAGLSTKTLMWRAVSSTIIFAYLMENKTSILVLVPSGLGVLIEYWKVLKACKVSLSFRCGIPRFSMGTQSAKEAETDSIDAQAMYYLTAVLVPLCIGGAAYSLLYQPHRSWRSWLLETAANGVYAFGFLFMLPQLFVNYKLKSVAHLPWRAFMYKAFNTFIDDLFAFIITMPTAHRVACFRDDIVFLVYLYQRWLYPVDKSRVNEYGEDFMEEEPKKEKTTEEKRPLMEKEEEEGDAMDTSYARGANDSLVDSLSAAVAGLNCQSSPNGNPNGTRQRKTKPNKI